LGAGVAVDVALAGACMDPCKDRSSRGSGSRSASASKLLLVGSAAVLLGRAASVRTRLGAVSTTTCGDGGAEREDHQDILERLLGEKSERREEQSVQSAGQVRKNVKTKRDGRRNKQKKIFPAFLRPR